MAVKEVIVTFEVKVSWWVYIYLGTINFICWLTWLEPDMEKVNFWVEKGIKLVLVEDENQNKKFKPDNEKRRIS